MKTRIFRHLGHLLLSTALFLPHAGNGRNLEVLAGKHHRIQSIVVVGDPGDLPPNPALRTPDGKILPLQKDGYNSLISFILPDLPAGQTILLEPISLAAPAPELATAADVKGNVVLTSRGKEVLTYQFDTKNAPEGIDPLFLRGGYLHPLKTPSGQIVTDDYPPNHLHHHGIWMAWTKARFDGRETDFWNMGQGKGRVEFVQPEGRWNGPVFAMARGLQRYVDLTSGMPVPVLTESWTVRVFAVDEPANPYHLIDLYAEQRMIGGKPLELPEYHYGGLGVRGLMAWNGKDNASFLTSMKSTDRIEQNGKPQKWVRMSGKAGTSTASIAVLGNTINVRSIQPVRIHPTEPFISFAPQISGKPISIVPPRAYQAKYRFVIADGEIPADLLDRLYQDYNHSPQAEWKR